MLNAYKHCVFIMLFLHYGPLLTGGILSEWPRLHSFPDTLRHGNFTDASWYLNKIGHEILIPLNYSNKRNWSQLLRPETDGRTFIKDGVCVWLHYCCP